jgi:hypothetical protein
MYKANLRLTIGAGHGGEMRGLKKTAALLLGVTVPKDYQLSDWRAEEFSPGQVAYACADAVLTRRVWGRSVSDLAANDLGNAYALQRNAIIPVADMEGRGLKLDLVEHARLVDTWSCDLSAARHFLLDVTKSSTPETNDETRKWLAGVLPAEELARWKCTPTGKPSFEADRLAGCGKSHRCEQTWSCSG